MGLRIACRCVITLVLNVGYASVEAARAKRRLPFAQVLGGKGGGKPGQAQGQGPEVDCIDDAVRAALEFAALKLD